MHVARRVSTAAVGIYHDALVNFERSGQPTFPGRDIYRAVSNKSSGAITNAKWWMIGMQPKMK
jgi:hypothetical protein